MKFSLYDENKKLIKTIERNHIDDAHDAFFPTNEYVCDCISHHLTIVFVDDVENYVVENDYESLLTEIED